MNTILDNKITLDRETHRYSLLDNPEIVFTSVTTYLDYFFEGFDGEKVAKKLIANVPKYKGGQLSLYWRSGMNQLDMEQWCMMKLKTG